MWCLGGCRLGMGGRYNGAGCGVEKDFGFCFFLKFRGLWVTYFLDVILFGDFEVF